VFRQAITDAFIVYGKRRVGGLMVFFHSIQGGTGAHFRYFVVAVAGHRVQGVVQWMLNDENVSVDGAGKVTSGKYANNAWLWFQRGQASETANSTFVAECGGKWTANHKGNGVAAIYAKFKLTDDVVQAGMPNITAVITGKDDIHDPRTGTDGYTNNGPLVFYDWMQIPREEGGFGAYDDEIPEDAWISAQANVADESVGGEARYALDAYLTTGSSPAEVRDSMVVNMAGTYTFTGGKHLVRPGYWVPVSATLSEDDLAAAIQVSPFMPADAAANEVQGTFIDPAAELSGAAVHYAVDCLCRPEAAERRPRVHHEPEPCEPHCGDHAQAGELRENRRLADEHQRPRLAGDGYGSTGQQSLRSEQLRLGRLELGALVGLRRRSATQGRERRHLR
jgi:hypothetical protein